MRMKTRPRKGVGIRRVKRRRIERSRIRRIHGR